MQRACPAGCRHGRHCCTFYYYASQVENPEAPRQLAVFCTGAWSVLTAKSSALYLLQPRCTVGSSCDSMCVCPTATHGCEGGVCKVGLDVHHESTNTLVSNCLGSALVRSALTSASSRPYARSSPILPSPHPSCCCSLSVPTWPTAHPAVYARGPARATAVFAR